MRKADALTEILSSASLADAWATAMAKQVGIRGELEVKLLSSEE